MSFDEEYLDDHHECRCEIERLTTENAFLKAFFEMHSPKMDGSHSWRFRMPGWGREGFRGPNIDAAIANAMVFHRKHATQHPSITED